MNHVPHLTTLILLTILISCGKSDDVPPDDDWTVGTTGHKLVQGKYAVEYRIKQDSCIPSLQSVLDKSDFEPSPLSIIEHIGARSEGRDVEFYSEFSRIREKSLAEVQGKIGADENVLDRLTSFNDFPGEFQPRCSDTELALRRYDNAVTA
jgi:hypothetical protein